MLLQQPPLLGLALQHPCAVGAGPHMRRPQCPLQGSLSSCQCCPLIPPRLHLPGQPHLRPGVVLHGAAWSRIEGCISTLVMLLTRSCPRACELLAGESAVEVGEGGCPVQMPWPLPSHLPPLPALRLDQTCAQLHLIQGPSRELPQAAARVGGRGAGADVGRAWQARAVILLHSLLVLVVAIPLPLPPPRLSAFPWMRGVAPEAVSLQGQPLGPSSLAWLCTGRR